MATASGMPSYQFWMEQARRWDECVDYGSVMTAWTPRMFEILRECDGDKIKATEQLRRERRDAKAGV